jgi:hypothetical protein
MTEPSTNQLPSEAEEIVRSGTRSGRGKPWRDRTECLKGHPYTPENILWRAHGARRCRKCALARGRRWYAERGAAARTARRQQARTAAAEALSDTGDLAA